ncbi:DUF6241 domain-containing protein [Salirhabdus sp. Marseille-P4669]|uniref:DUF6241 domain-containing protein n=1 Tax=Salirhabdus sp. Marseille-P4669 TaxID=2042310 RepID=UPI000C7DA719|nr:DUF6241 domain-containing protein [Salirhabdus sp. Marseille-P4669]
MKKTLLYIGIVIISSAVLTFGTIKWFESLSNDSAEEEATNEEKEKTEKKGVTEVESVAATEQLESEREQIKGTISDADIDHFLEQGLNPFGTKVAMEQLDDAHYQEYIHGMSHQKVRAEKKWGFYELHPRRVEWLLEGLEKVDLQHEQVYRNILEKWAQGDFSEVDRDHNAIWSIQGGTVGRATGILSTAEEQEYIESQ